MTTDLLHGEESKMWPERKSEEINRHLWPEILGNVGFSTSQQLTRPSQAVNGMGGVNLKGMALKKCCDNKSGQNASVRKKCPSLDGQFIFWGRWNEILYIWSVSTCWGYGLVCLNVSLICILAMFYTLWFDSVDILIWRHNSSLPPPGIYWKCTQAGVLHGAWARVLSSGMWRRVSPVKKDVS
jgi:hypothetical protein